MHVIRTVCTGISESLVGLCSPQILNESGGTFEENFLRLCFQQRTLYFGQFLMLNNSPQSFIVW
jgi:hypothetical protein